MPFYINHTDGTSLVTVADGTIDNTTTNLTLVGKNFPTYGQYINQNLITLLENSANSSAPDPALKGQLWYDSTNKLLKFYRQGSTTSAWQKLATTTESATAPTDPRFGDLWWDTANTQLKIYDTNSQSWLIVGPQTTNSGRLNVTGNNSFILYIGGNPYLNIDTFGGLTLPKNPLLSGYDHYFSGSPSNLTSGGIGTFNTWKPIETIDRGNNFNPTTGTFTVSTAGVYKVYCQVTTFIGTTDGNIILKWQKNSSDANITVKSNIYNSTMAANSNTIQLVCSGMISAVVGDTIKLLYSVALDATTAISYTNSSYNIQLVG
jgi:hypothetical protein